MSVSQVLLKLSGEFLPTLDGTDTVHGLALIDVLEVVQDLHRRQIKVSLVLGGGNICRGESFAKLRVASKVAGHHVGMLATTMNALILSSILGDELSLSSAVLNSVAIPGLCEGFSVARASALHEEGKILLLSGGTGNPLFTTDTAAALRAIELEADMVIKATKVKGVYDKDPIKHSDAEFLPELTFDEAIQKDLSVMDTSAFALCKENAMPIAVVDASDKEALLETALGRKGHGSWIVP